jgi:hypothetical protein
MPEIPTEEAGTDLPATGSDAYKARRLKKHFLKYGDYYSSRLFESLAPEVQDYFLAKAQLPDSELVVFGFYEDKESWIFATTRRIFWSRPGFHHQLKYGQIKSIGQSEYRKLAQQPEDSMSVEERSRRIREIKGDSPWLYFIHDNDNFSEALVPPGEPLFAIWNTIQFMIRLDNIHPVIYAGLNTPK